MKKLFLLFVFCSSFIYAQDKDQLFKKLDSLGIVENKCLETKDYDFCRDMIADTREEIYEELYKQNVKEINELGLYDASIEYLENKRKSFIENYSKLLELDNYDNIDIQNAILQPYDEKYNNGKKLSFVFENKEGIKSFIKSISNTLLRKILRKQLELIVNYRTEEYQRIEKYINKNLKRLNISRKTFDEMSDNDKAVLWKSFKN
ncbi:hypothetical protein OKE80_01000 [Riemerella anatipestifer]|nr:hypothetical protein [Riemerella anatipestifer]AZZ58349.1 hypothetical protein AWB57_04475 [Riemerella anatipestifer]MCO7317782.1 hypothetical protein [Riemerella anatipestifer]MCW0473408.1 hypothetical protein [Riemerella anatipestifer]MDY3396136.1 hypothetical protein [Riemerella anatipestifer]MDY3408872.1 hypothetical protein [Riemerella anatipestifer]